MNIGRAHTDPRFPGLVLLSDELQPLDLSPTGRELLRLRGYVVAHPAACEFESPAQAPVDGSPGPQERGG